MLLEISQENALKKSLILLFSIQLLLALFLSSNSSAQEEKIRVAVFVDRGAHAKPMLRDALSESKDIQVAYIYGDDIRNGCLDQFDLLFVPGGSGKKEAQSLESSGCDEIRRFVAHGGLYFGVCAGTYLLSHGNPRFLGLLPVTTVDAKHWRRGKTKLSVEFTPLGMEVFGIDRKILNIVYHNGPVLRKTNDANDDDITALAYFRDEIVAKGGKRGLMIGAPAVVLGRYKKGFVLGLSPHPEATPGLENLEPNAIRWLYKHSNKINK
jgi:glutamine amidotransferase-like uncharacterized protein